MRRRFAWIGAAAAGVLAIGLGALLVRKPAAPPLGIVLWVIDTCRADRLGIYDPARATTPFLDRLAAESVVFERCFAQAPWTKPAMAALLSGRHPSSVNVHGLLDRLDDSVPTLAEALAAGGYHTAGFSANPLVGRWSNYTQGFDEYVEATEVVPRRGFGAVTGGSAAALLKRVLPWLSANGQRPFFLLIQSMDPHEEYQPAAEYLARFADPNDEPRYRREWSLLKQAHPAQIGNHCTADTFAQAGVDRSWFIDYGKGLYDANLLATDSAVEQLWAHLVTLGIADRVVLIVTADHGEEFMEHGGTSHGFSLYDELLHIPLFIHAPGVLPAGGRVAEPVRAIDLYPTILAMAGVPFAAGVEGESLLALANGATGERRAPLIFAEKQEGRGLHGHNFRTGNGTSVIAWPWKLIENSQLPAGRDFPLRELYRLDRDPAETSNLIDTEPERVAQLSDAIRRHVAAAGAGTTATPGTAGAPEMEPETVERLRQLGYAD